MSVYRQYLSERLSACIQKAYVQAVGGVNSLKINKLYCYFMMGSRSMMCLSHLFCGKTSAAVV